MARRRKAKYRTLKELLEQFGKVAVANAKKKLLETADAISDEAKSSNAFQDRTGNLRASIHREERRSGLKQVIVVTAKNAKGESYPWYVEARKPFLYPAVDAHKNGLHDALLKAIKDGVKSV